MKSRAELFVLGMLVAAASPVAAQTIITPPRSLHAKAETAGVDSTLSQSNVQPNTSNSTVTLNFGPAAPPPPPPPPTLCTPGAPTPAISNVQVNYDYDNSQDPPTADDGYATWTATVNGESTTVTTPRNYGGTMTTFWTVGGYGYNSDFVCRVHQGERGGRGGGSSLQVWVVCSSPSLTVCQ